MILRRLLAALCVAALTSGLADAQGLSLPQSPVLTVDQEALFENSAFGKRLQADFDRDSAALAAENRQIEAELEAEELRLTEERPDMDPAAFREKAAAFDAKVVEIRRTQDQKARELTRAPEEARQRFFRAALPVLTAVVRERGGLVILDSRAVILAADAIDITDEAIRRLDAELGDGSAVPADPAPRPEAPDAPQPPATGTSP